MAGSTPYRSYETSWADQWDTDHDALASSVANKKSSNGVGSAIDKTKSVASTGFKKVKAGTSSGFHWIKDKYNKTAHKH